MGVGTSSITVTWEKNKGALAPLRQTTHDTINTLGLRVPGKGTHWHRKGQPAFICQMWAWFASLATTVHSGYYHPCLCHYCPTIRSAGD
jgi:hypothetical protein